MQCAACKATPRRSFLLLQTTAADDPIAHDADRAAGTRLAGRGAARLGQLPPARAVLVPAVSTQAVLVPAVSTQAGAAGAAACRRRPGRAPGRSTSHRACSGAGASRRMSEPG